MLYSEAFRRLGDVTQVAQGTPDMGLHNRLTHSLKVEQVGLSLVSRLSAPPRPKKEHLDPDAVAAACLAHDVGHPPFGHAGEEALNELVVCAEHRPKEQGGKGVVRTAKQRYDAPCADCRLEDGFEGNAQTFRILTALAVHREMPSGVPLGLDLTRASLAAVSKYPWLRGDPAGKQRKWGAYDCDSDTLTWVQGDLGTQRTVYADVMDWADDIAYAVHDIEDFYRIGRVPLDEYRPKAANFIDFLAYCDLGHLKPISAKEREVFTSFVELCPTRRFSGSADDLAALDALRGTLLMEYINAADLVAGELEIDPLVKRSNSIVQQLIWFHIIHDPELFYIQQGQRRVLEEIFEILLPILEEAYPAHGPLHENELRRLPTSLRHAVDVVSRQTTPYTHKQKLTRALLDYISSLSDLGAYALHARLRGREGSGHL